MFGVAIHIALKMAIKSNYVLQKTFTTFTNLNFRLVQQKIRKREEKTATIWAQKLLKMTS